MGETDVQIIPFYSHPHVLSVIKDNTFYDETTATPVEEQLPFSTAVAAGADQGIDNKFIRLSSLSEKIALFGRGNFDKYGQSSLQADVLFNGSTTVWFCRVLPDNATYSNVILLINYRKGDELDASGHETGLKRMEVKFSVGYCQKPYIVDGAVDEDAIIETANAMAVTEADPTTGYFTLPVFFTRPSGRGEYGDQFSIKVSRDPNAENEYQTKMYAFSLIRTSALATQIYKVFAGSLYQTTRDGLSTLIDDVMDMIDVGKAPIDIYSFEENFDTLYEFYQNIVAENETYLSSIDATDEQKEELELAKSIDESEFDPLFGYVMYTRTNQTIPYYKNYTTKDSGPYVAPDMQVATASNMPRNISAWGTAKVGATVLVLADENNDGLRWRYTVTNINADTGDITYDDGVQNEVDDDQYDGINISASAGMDLIGGSDGDFSEISDGTTTRKPNQAEMKLLLAREQVKAFRGEKDRNILSPARISMDFLFDANYNLTQEGLSSSDKTIQALYSNSTVLTDKDYQKLSVVGSADIDLSDINVKEAMFDLTNFRNRNGMTINPEYGAGMSTYFDCGLVGKKSSLASSELNDIIIAMENFNNRACSVDLGWYNIFDPYTGKRIAVTVSYFLAENLIPHLMNNGLNAPFTMGNARLTAVQKNNALANTNAMIRDTFHPDIDLIDWDIKERLYKARFNYYTVEDEGRTVTRACQNTRQTDASQLLEENNVRVLNTLKKGLEKACQGYLYQWNEPATRKGYTDSQMQVYRPWIGTMVEDINIRFDANEWEETRAIMHCYVDVIFRNIIKTIIVEININRSANGGE